jgi:hypothetical protein
VSKVVKPTPAELMEDTGTGLDYGTRPDRMPGYLVPNDRFYVRSHAPTPAVDVADWTLRIEGDGVRRPGCRAAAPRARARRRTDPAPGRG